MDFAHIDSDPLVEIHYVGITGILRRVFLSHNPRLQLRRQRQKRHHPGRFGAAYRNHQAQWRLTAGISQSCFTNTLQPQLTGDELTLF